MWYVHSAAFLASYSFDQMIKIVVAAVHVMGIVKCSSDGDSNMQLLQPWLQSVRSSFSRHYNL